jgi:lipopolysaccharide export system permease protein
MRLSTTLFIYIARQFFVSFFIVLGGFAVVIYLIDLIELMRSFDGIKIGFTKLLLMTLYKLPLVLQKILPFAILIGTTLTYLRLSKSSEMAVIRAAGFSPLAFVMPSAAVSIIIGIVYVSLLNPLSSHLIRQYKELRSNYGGFESSFAKAAKNGVWIRQQNPKAIIYAKSIDNTGKFILKDAMIIAYNKGDFDTKLISPSIILEDGYWSATNAKMVNKKNQVSDFETYFFNTDLKNKDIKNRFIDSEDFSVWQMREQIKLYDKTGIPSNPIKLDFINILLSPLMFLGMCLLGMLFSIPKSRRYLAGGRISSSIFVSFIIYVACNVIYSFALTNKMPVLAASSLPIVLILLAGFYGLLHLEDS